MLIGVQEMPRRKRDPEVDFSQPSREGKVSTAVWMTPEERDALKVLAIETGTTVQEILKACVDKALAKRTRKS